MSKIILPDNLSSSSSSPVSSPYFRSNTNTSKSQNNPTPDSSSIYELCTRVSALEKENNSFKKHIAKEGNFYKSIARLSSITMVLLLILPVIQLLIMAILVYFLRDDNAFINLLKGGFAVIGIATIFEMLYIPKKINELEKQIEKLEKEVGKPVAEITTYQE